jgi:hypothetical protein
VTGALASPRLEAGTTPPLARQPPRRQRGPAARSSIKNYCDLQSVMSLRVSSVSAFAINMRVLNFCAAATPKPLDT